VIPIGNNCSIRPNQHEDRPLSRDDFVHYLNRIIQLVRGKAIVMLMTPNPVCNGPEMKRYIGDEMLYTLREAERTDGYADGMRTVCGEYEGTNVVLCDTNKALKEKALDNDVGLSAFYVDRELRLIHCDEQPDIAVDVHLNMVGYLTVTETAIQTLDKELQSLSL
jgi:hypothetical protein